MDVSVAVLWLRGCRARSVLEFTKVVVKASVSTARNCRYGSRIPALGMNVCCPDGLGRFNPLYAGRAMVALSGGRYRSMAGRP